MMSAEHIIARETEKEVRFGFGDNWADYAQYIEPIQIVAAKAGLSDLLDDKDLAGKTFLDIGSGSGLHSLAALQKGVKTLTALDYDPMSVKTTKAVLTKFWSQDNYTVEQGDILAKNDSLSETYDIVYSWGVLHHTGNMWQAIENAAKKVCPNGKLVIALYKKTPFCGFWKFEKRLYSSLPKILRMPIDYIYATLYLLGLMVRGKNPARYVCEYSQQRGMNWMIDVRDWLGGYPYESASAAEVESFMKSRGFSMVKTKNIHPVAAKGLFGSGCAEYVFERDGA